MQILRSWFLDPEKQKHLDASRGAFVFSVPIKIFLYVFNAIIILPAKTFLTPLTFTLREWKFIKPESLAVVESEVFWKKTRYVANPALIQGAFPLFQT